MSSPSPEPSHNRGEWIYPLTAALLPVIAVLLTLPFMESGINDDWSYAHSALDYARTGRLIYNGWATAMLGAQILWGALFIKLFGFSFTVLRLSLLPFAAGSGALLYGISRRAGVRPDLSLLLGGTIMVSPVSLPLAASFMTDIPGLFFLLLGLYACIRFDGESGRSPAVFWLLLAAAAGVVGGTIRQPVALVAIGVLPYCLWRRRQDRTVVVVGILLWVVALLLVRWGDRWFHSQPYALSEDTIEAIKNLIKITPFWMPLFSRFIPTLVIMTLPITALTVFSGLRRMKKRETLAVLLLSAVGLALLVLTDNPLHRKTTALFGETLWPYWGDLVNRNGVSWNLYKQIPTFTLPIYVQWALVAFVYFSLSYPVVVLVFGLLERARQRTKNPAISRSDYFNSATAINLAFVICYFPLLPIRLAMEQGIVLDRYLIPVLPLVCMLLLLKFQANVAGAEDNNGRSLRTVSWILFGSIAAYSVFISHDFFTACRARLEAAALLRGDNIPRTRIAAGFDYDCWTQIEATGYLNEKRIKNPPDAFKPYKEESCTYHSIIFDWIPSVLPQYVVLVNPGDLNPPGLSDTHYPPIPYRTWLPPFSHKVEIKKNECR